MYDPTTHLEPWTEMLDSGDPIDAVYLDFRKAFDSLPYQRLHAKIAAYGFNGKSWTGLTVNNV
jgi:hypothetical protein